MGIPNLINEYGPRDSEAYDEIRRLRHELAVTRAQLGLPAEVPEPPRVRECVDPSLTPMQRLAKSIYPDSLMKELDMGKKKKGKGCK